LKGHAYGNVETNDMQQSIKDVLGLNLDWFFDEWIYRGGEPHFRVHYEDLSYNNGSKATEIAIEQIHAMSETVQAFKMPIAIEVHYTDGTKDSIMEMVDEVFEVVKIPNRAKKEIAFVLFDPNSNVMKQLTLEKKFDKRFGAIFLENFLGRCSEFKAHFNTLISILYSFLINL
jgi:aminopeptidase N